MNILENKLAILVTFLLLGVTAGAQQNTGAPGTVSGSTNPGPITPPSSSTINDTMNTTNPMPTDSTQIPNRKMRQKIKKDSIKNSYPASSDVKPY